MQQFSSLLTWRLFTAQHVLGVFPPIIRSSMTTVVVRPRTQHAYHQDTKVKPEAATSVIELQMMGGKTPKTCWAVNKRQDNKLENCCIWLVIYLNCTMMHGLTNPKKSWYFVDRAFQYNLFFISNLIHCFFVYVQYLLSSFLYMFQASQAHHQEV